MALGASHLSQHGDSDYTIQGLHHRLAAIRLLAGTLSVQPETAIDADALFAANYCLVSQSSLMPDNGMVEHITLMRGASLVLTTILPKFSDSIFRDFAVHGIFNSLPSVIREQPKDDGTIDSFRTSAGELEALCQSSTETEYWSCIMKCIDLATVCSVQGK